MTEKHISKIRKEAAISMAQFLYDMYKEKEASTPIEEDVLVIPSDDKESK